MPFIHYGEILFPSFTNYMVQWSVMMVMGMAAIAIHVLCLRYFQGIEVGS